MITTFKIADQKAIKRAECVHVPRVMIIKGQNGVGKSTLLYVLKRKIIGNGVTKEDVIFISPTGESQQNEHTEADVHRDDPSYRITSVLSRLEIARRNIIATSSLLDNNDRSLADEYKSISYIYEPLNNLLNILLPHLKFERVDISDSDSPKCIFNRDTQSGTSHPQNPVDIDELSRGEIGVISQFLALVEHQILRKLVRRSDRSFSDIVVLMDMPALYLPPQLQSRLLEYVRSVVKEENERVQFIIVTSSSDLIDKANAEELFLLLPSQLLIEGSNQLVNVSDAKRCLSL